MDPNAQHEPIIEAESASSRLIAGTDFAAYHLVELLRSHGQYETFLTEHKQLGRRCIIKHGTQVDSIEAADHFQDLMAGAAKAARLQSRMTPVLLDVVTAPQPFYVRAFVAGENLTSSSTLIEFSDRVESTLVLIDLLVELHREGIYHGNLLLTNCILNDENEIVITDFSGRSDAECAARDVRAIGQLIQNWVLVETEHDSHLGETRMSPAAPQKESLLKVAQHACMFNSLHSVAELLQISERIKILGVRPAHLTQRERREKQGALLRGIPMVVSGGIMLVVVALESLGYSVLLILEGIKTIGPISQMAMLTVAPPLIFGVALLRSGIEYIRRSSRKTRRGRTELISNNALPSFAESTRGDLGTTIEVSPKPATSLPTQTSRYQLGNPALTQIRVKQNSNRVLIKRRIGSRIGLAILILVFVVSISGIGQTIAGTQFQDSGAVRFMLVGICSAVIATIVVTVAFSRLLLRPDLRAEVSRSIGWLRKLVLKFGLWSGFESTICDHSGLELKAPLGFRGATTKIPWDDIWDIKPGSKVGGIEIATTSQGLLSFAVGASDLERNWLALSLNEMRFAANQASDEEEFNQLLSQVVQKIEGPRTTFHQRWFSFSNHPLDISIFCLIGVYLLPIVTLFELIFSCLSPSAVPAGSVVVPFETGFNHATAIISIAGITMITLGFLRLRQSRRSGGMLVKTGYWSMVITVLFAWIILSIIQAMEFEMIAKLTTAVNLSTFLHSLTLAYTTVFVILLLLRNRSLDLVEG